MSIVKLNFTRNPKNPSRNSSTNLSSLSDKNLYQLCKNYGYESLKWRWKFIGLLPEVNKRKLYEKKGFESIFVFAKKLAGISEEQVHRALNLEEKFSTMPTLQTLLVKGEVSINKLARVASIATTKNEEFLAHQVKILSKSAVETFIKDERWAAKNESGFDRIITGNSSLIGQQKSDDFKIQNGLFKLSNSHKSVPGHNYTSNEESNSQKSNKQNFQAFFDLKLSPEIQQKLLKLQQKGIDINELLLEFLQKREQDIKQRKEEISRKVLEREEKKKTYINEVSEYCLEKPKMTRYKPTAVTKILEEEYGTKCAIPHCQKQATETHHALPFSMSQSHDPHFLFPLCKEHHELEHSINSQYQKYKFSTDIKIF